MGQGICEMLVQEPSIIIRSICNNMTVIVRLFSYDQVIENDVRHWLWPYLFISNVSFCLKMRLLWEWEDWCGTMHVRIDRGSLDRISLDRITWSKFSNKTGVWSKLCFITWSKVLINHINISSLDRIFWDFSVDRKF